MMNEDVKLEVIEMGIDDVMPYDNNPRLNDDAVDAVAESINNYGWRQPIVVDKDNVIICGHTRLLAAKKLGLKKVPVHIAHNLAPEKVKAYRLDDNKTSELATWDFAKLQQELLELKDSEYDMSSLAFGDEELARLFDNNEGEQNQEEDIEGETDPDNTPEVNESEYNSVSGGIYQLGKHRLVCGDCTEGLDIAKLLEGDGTTPVRLWLTDPPYNVDYSGMADVKRDVEHRKSARNKNLKIENDNMGDEEFKDFINRAFENCIAYLEPGASYYIFHAHTIAHVLRDALVNNDTNLSNQLIWVKNNFSLGWGCYMMQHEPIWFGWKNGGNHRWFGPHDSTTTTTQKWNMTQSNKIHPTMKPVEMLKFFIRNSSADGDIVLDTFGGSGSTLIACEQTGRICRMMEIMPKYVDAIRKRYAEFVHGEGCDWVALTPKIGDVVK